jgi:uncharacterized protein
MDRVRIFITAKKRSVKGYTLIEGFPGMGLVGTIATKHLIDTLKFKELGYIEAPYFLPIVRVHNGQPVFPSRIYYNDEFKLVALISEQIIPKDALKEFALTVIDWAKKSGIKRIISIEGIRVEGANKNAEIVYGIGCNEKSKKELKKHGVKLVSDGITTGVTALLLLELSKQNKMLAYSLLGNVHLTADYKAAAETLKKLNEMLNLNLNVEPLIKESKQIEKALLENLQKLRETHDSISRLEQQTRSAPMYT